MEQIPFPPGQRPRQTLTGDEHQALATANYIILGDEPFLAAAQPLADGTLSVLLSKLNDAQQQACLLRTCPICQLTFTQLKAGRAANYCSAACKQKAYRQRRDRARRQFDPRRHTS